LTPEQTTRAALAYQAYTKALTANGGLPLPAWETLQPAMRAAWVDACEAARADKLPSKATVAPGGGIAASHAHHAVNNGVHATTPPPPVHEIELPELPDHPLRRAS